MRSLLIMILPALLLAGAGGCSIYKIDIQQGNTLEAEQVEKLNTGMTREQVAYLLGTPLIQDPFHANRWDYVYSFKPGGSKPKSQHLTLHFDNGTLTKIDRDQFRDYKELFTPTNRGLPDTASQSTGGGSTSPAPPRTPPGGGLPSP
ncbi:MAG: outer membrane protein assembly factor BamE [Thiohalophilus sp.]